MKKISNLFYFLFFLALSFPAKAFGMADLYGPPSNMQVKYGPPMQALYGVEFPTPVEKVTSYAQLAAVILVPIAVIVLIILGIRKIRKKK
jgi:hypothetical protein